MFIDKLNLTESEKTAVLQRADEMLRGDYIFDGRWDMEPCPEPVNNSKLSWRVRYNNDPEWSFMFTRMDYLYYFITATEIAGDEKYIRHGLAIFEQWYKTHRYCLYYRVRNAMHLLGRKEPLGIRTLDTAIMAANVTDYVFYCAQQGYINETTLKKYKERLRRIVSLVLLHSNNEKKTYSNWGVIENASSLYCLSRLGVESGMNSAVERLLRQMMNQIYANGSHTEASPMYLVEILLVLLRLCGCAECTIKDKLRTPVLRMCEYLANVRRPDNHLPNIGDSDLTELSDVFYIAAKIMDKPGLLSLVRRTPDVEFCVRYDLPRERFDNVGADGEPAESLTEYPQQTVIRGGNGAYLLCSNIPKVYDGHKHYDYMSVLWCEDGEDILIDPGRYSYKSGSERNFYIGPEAHNVIAANDDRFYRVATSFCTAQRIECRDNEVIKNGDAVTVGMSCVYGYSEARIRRFVTYIPGEGLMITDLVDDETDAEYTAYFDLGEELSAEPSGNKTVVTGRRNTLYYGNDSGIKAQTKPIPYSPRYNEKTDVTQLRLAPVGRRTTHFFLKDDAEPQVAYTADSIEYRLGDKSIIIPLKKNSQ